MGYVYVVTLSESESEISEASPKRLPAVNSSERK